jgi:O-succinylbenzoic acid--CoA ligase
MSALSVLAAARERPDAIALVDADGRTTSWRALAADVTARITHLAALGLDGRDPGVRVAIRGEPTRERVVDVLAAIEIGVPIVMLHPRWSAAERARVLEATAPAAILEGDAPPAPRASPDVVLPHAIDAERALAIVFTSGTTGTPRGAILSRRAFLASAAASAANLPLTPSDRWLLCLPLAHVGGLSILVRCLAARAAVAIAGPFSASATRDAMARTRPTLLSLVPTMLDLLLDEDLAPLPELRAILLGGAACPPRLLGRALAAGLPIRTTYGLTEACSQVTTARSDVRSPEDGAGEPLPGIEVRIGAEGTIRIRGPTLFDGYLGESRPPLDGDGFYDTGDLGVFDERGRLHVLARRTDLIVTGGENVYPAAVETALEEVPGIRAACVFGVPDDRWGAIVAAAIVAGPEAPSDAELRERLRTRLAAFAIPRRFARLPALALTPSGKLDRAATAREATPRLR